MGHKCKTDSGKSGSKCVNDGGQKCEIARQDGGIVCALCDGGVKLMVEVGLI